MVTLRYCGILLLFVLAICRQAECGSVDEKSKYDEASKEVASLMKECRDLKQAREFLKMQTNSIYMFEAAFISKLNGTQLEIYSSIHEEIGKGNLPKMALYTANFDSTLTEAQRQELNTLLSRGLEARNVKREYDTSKDSFGQKKQHFFKILKSLDMGEVTIFGFERLFEECERN